jgi:phosphate/sulfate permease
MLGFVLCVLLCKSGQMSTIRNLLMAWVLTLPASLGLSALLFWTFNSWMAKG